MSACIDAEVAKLEFLFLGTSSGVPTTARNVSGLAFIESRGSAWYLIDCGEGTQHQLLRTSLSLNDLSCVFLTHLHGDHCFGLPGLLASAGLNGRKAPLRIVAPPGAKEWIQSTMRMTDTYLPYEIEFIETKSGTTLETSQFTVSVIALSHRIDSFGYIFLEKVSKVALNVPKIKQGGIPQGPLWGALQVGKDVEYQGLVHKSSDYTDPVRLKRVIVCGDNDQPERLESIQGEIDLLVHEATFAEDMAERALEVGHSYARQVARVAEKMGIPNLILTHLSARYTSDVDVLESEAKAEYSGNLNVASDFQRYRLGSSLQFLPNEKA